MTKRFKANKVANFKAATNRVVSTNNAFIGLFDRQEITDRVNNKGSNNNPRYNPDVIAIPKHRATNLYRGQ